MPTWLSTGGRQARPDSIGGRDVHDPKCPHPGRSLHLFHAVIFVYIYTVLYSYSMMFASLRRPTKAPWVPLSESLLILRSAPSPQTSTEHQ